MIKLNSAADLVTLAAAAFALAGFALAVLSLVLGARKKNLAALNARLDDFERESNKNHTALQSSLENLKTALRREQSEAAPWVDPVDALKSRVDALERNMRNSDAANKTAAEVLTQRADAEEDARKKEEENRKIREDIKKGALDPLEVFNSWAANPAAPLPEAFYYLHGEFRIRGTHTFKESAAPSRWITNREGSKKYLLPNPNFFDQMTNISELYTMNRAQLKGKGQNRIRVIKPCEMADKGWIDYPGELQHL
ncbi:MAG: hypothetical protein LBD18_06655 [Treponema sp.]|jgi:hypothetical protein|nr:hypothetical protein [Treponema sp.]